MAQSAYLKWDLCRGVAVDPVIAIEAIADVGMKNILNAIEASTSEKEFADVFEKSADQIAGYGYSNIYTAKLANKDDIVHSLLKQHFVYGVHAEYAQFIEGMNTVSNFGNVVLANKSVFDNILSNEQPSSNPSMSGTLLNKDLTAGSKRRVPFTALKFS